MQRHIAWLWGVEFFGLIAIANAQSASTSPANTKFDGTYVFVSATRLNETYATRATEHIKQCAEIRKAAPLIIANGQARRYSGNGQLQFEGTVGPQGELTMRLTPRPGGKNSPGIEITVNGKIDNDGTARARQTGYYCRYDFVWQKVSK